MSASSSLGVLTPSQEGALIAQIISAVPNPINLSNWPLYVYYAVSTVYSAVKMSESARQNVIISILQTIVNDSSVLSSSQKTELNDIIQSTGGAVITALIQANTTVDNWVEMEAKSWWSKVKAWCVKHGCCKCCCRADDSSDSPVPVTTPAPVVQVKPTPVVQTTTPVPAVVQTTTPVPAVVQTTTPVPAVVQTTTPVPAVVQTTTHSTSGSPTTSALLPSSSPTPIQTTASTEPSAEDHKSEVELVKP